MVFTIITAKGEKQYLILGLEISLDLSDLEENSKCKNHSQENFFHELVLIKSIKS